MSATWSVVVGEPNDRGRPDGGDTQEVVIKEGDEAAARDAFTAAKRTATALAYRNVLLRRDKGVVERWP